MLLTQTQKQIFSIIAAAIILVGAGFYFQQYRKTHPAKSPEAPAGIVIDTPAAGAVVSFPLVIRGRITGESGWAPFEGHAGTVQAIDDQGPLSEIGALLIGGDWTILPANFEATLGMDDTVSKIKADTGYLLFRNENPSGLPENNREFRLPVKYAKDQ